MKNLRNIRLAYFISAFHHTWFWLGTWVLYYSKFGGNYAVGLLEFVMVFTTIMAEIPTGAVGDLLGKRKTLILGYLLLTISSFWMGLSTDLANMIISLIILNVGSAFISGTFDALIYDTLKENKKTSEYTKIQNKISSFILIAFGICSIIGGYLASIDIRYTYFGNGIGQFIALILSFYLIEPSIDSEKLSVKTYLNQNIAGIKHLFRTSRISGIVIPMLLMSAVLFLFNQSFNDIMLLDFGFRDRPIDLGIYASITSFVGAFIIYILPKFVKKKNEGKLYFGNIIVYSLSLFISPFVWLYSGALSIFFRSVLTPLMDNHIGYNINKVVDSKYRATALSAFSMIKSIPYAFVVIFLAGLTDVYPSKYIAVVLGIIVLLIALWELVKERKI